MTYLSTFSSSFDAILANRTLVSQGYEARLTPVPRAVSASCGTCVRFRAEALPLVVERTLFSGVYHEDSEGWKKIQ